MDKITKAKITRITNFLLEQGCTLVTKASTCSTYLKLQDVELRISDHFGREFHDIDIIVPYKGSGYVVMVDHTVITYQEFKDLKVFLENYCLFKNVGQTFYSKKLEKQYESVNKELKQKNETLNESVNQLITRITNLKEELDKLQKSETRNKLKQLLDERNKVVSKQNVEISQLKQELSSAVDLASTYKIQLDNAKDAIVQQRATLENNEQVNFFKTKLEAERQTNVKLMSELTELRNQHEKDTNKVYDLTRQLIVENPENVDINLEFDDFTLNINDFPPAYKEQILNFIKKMETKKTN